MTTSRTRLTEASNDFERELLRSWDSEQPSDSAHRAALGLLGAGAVLAAGAVGGSGAATASTAAASVAGGSIAPKATALGALAVGKWLAAGAVVAVVAGGTGVYMQSTSVRTRTERTEEATAKSAPRSATSDVATNAVRDLVTPPALVPSAPAAVGVEASASPAQATPSPASTPRASLRHGALSSAPGEASAIEGARPTGGLGEQVAALGLAEDALSRGDSGAAIRLIDAYERQFPNGLLAQESIALRIEALVQEGDVAAAGRLAGPFLAANPTSPHATRIRRLLAR